MMLHKKNSCRFAHCSPYNQLSITCRQSYLPQENHRGLKAKRQNYLHPLTAKKWFSIRYKLVADLNIPQVVIVGHQRDEVCMTIKNALPNAVIDFVTQEEQLGTGHALKCAQIN